MSLYNSYRNRIGTSIDTTSTGKNYPTLGEKLKSDSDKLMELTWNGDLQSKVGYIYDYAHDDQPDINHHMTYEHTTKTRVDVKVIVKSYSSMDKDQPEFYLQFKPSQKYEFEKNDELYYFEKDYRQKFDMEFPIGTFIDLPDDRGIYRKWIICEKEIANQFPKYLILPAIYRFMWIETDGNKRIKRKMWGANRSQKSYTIGTYTDRYITRPDNQTKAIVPLNSITDNLWYTDEESKNTRIVVSAPTKHPIVWTLTKVETVSPIGLLNLTFYQSLWNEHTDYIEKDENGKVIGKWANYFESEVLPTDSDVINPSSSIHATLSSSTAYIKSGGSYKTITATIFDQDNSDFTEEYSDAQFTWSCSIDGEDYTDEVVWRNGSVFNQMKLKFPSDSSKLGKLLNIKCVIEKDEKTIESKELELEIIE